MVFFLIKDSKCGGYGDGKLIDGKSASVVRWKLKNCKWCDIIGNRWSQSDNPSYFEAIKQQDQKVTNK